MGTLIAATLVIYVIFVVFVVLNEQNRVTIEDPNCEAWFESKGTGASLECPDAEVAIIIRGENCRYAFQNGKQMKLKCDNIELEGKIK